MFRDLDSCPYGPPTKDVEKGEPQWLEPARYRIPVGDRELGVGTLGTPVRATELSKETLESLLEVMRAYDAKTTATESEPDGEAFPKFWQVHQKNMEKYSP